MNGPVEGLGVGTQLIEANVQGRLGVVVVTQIAHPQGGGVLTEPGLVIEPAKLMTGVGNETGIQGRGRAEQQHQQPAATAEIANQPEILIGFEVLEALLITQRLLPDLPEAVGQRQVVMGAGNALHHPAITHRQALTIDMLQATDVGATVFGNGNAGITVQFAGHAGRPEHFVTQILLHKPVNVAQRLQHFAGT